MHNIKPFGFVVLLLIALAMDKATPKTVLRSDNEIIDEYFSGSFTHQGDMIRRKLGKAAPRADLPDLFANWPNNTVPYVISENVKIAGAISYLNKYTCVQFRPADIENDAHWIRFLYKDYDPVTAPTCAAELGFNGKKDQPVFMGSYCRAPLLVHELFHTLGFLHEHNRNDRDDYISIQYDNLIEGFSFQFIKDGEVCLRNNPKEQCDTNNYGIKYNYESIMHFCETCGAVNRTLKSFKIVPGASDYIGSPKNTGQMYGISEGDWLAVNRKYGCDPATTPGLLKPPPIPANPVLYIGKNETNWKESSIQPISPKDTASNKFGLFYDK